MTTQKQQVMLGIRAKDQRKWFAVLPERAYLRHTWIFFPLTFSKTATKNTNVKEFSFSIEAENWGESTEQLMRQLCPGLFSSTSPEDKATVLWLLYLFLLRLTKQKTQ